MDEVNRRREVLRRREERLAMDKPALRFPKVKVPIKNRRASSQPSARPKPLHLVSTALSALSQPKPQAEVFCHTTLLSSVCSSHNLTPGTGHLYSRKHFAGTTSAVFYGLCLCRPASQEKLGMLPSFDIFRTYISSLHKLCINSA
jgi:hypothetical protein